MNDLENTQEEKRIAKINIKQNGNLSEFVQGARADGEEEELEVGNGNTRSIYGGEKNAQGQK